MRREADAAAPSIDILIESALWKREPEHQAILRQAIAAAAREASSKRAELAIVLTNDSAIRALNRKWRGQDEPTNVLSFPAGNAGVATTNATHLGDIVIAFETTAREASSEGKPFAHHLAHLAVHGYLHLLGFEHETDKEAAVMERLEAEILSQLGVPNPHGSAAEA
jgi:probable rRNA maturation factor